MTKHYQVPVMDFPPLPNAPNPAARSQTRKQIVASKRIATINRQIRLLKDERRRLSQMVKGRERVISSNISLYALELEDAKWYIGMSHNVEKRFARHRKGKGAVWTRKFKPLRIAEVRPTLFSSQESVAAYEDDMTLEYALLYGAENVRGGQWCGPNPKWPPLVTEVGIPY